MSRDILKEQYGKLIKLMGMNMEGRYGNINFHIREILRNFMNAHKRVAIYCYGAHTQMLIADFVAELRDIVCIIDNGNVSDDKDFMIIRDVDIEKHGLDGIVVSSFRYREEIKQGLEKNHGSLDVLDIYDALEEYGVHLEEEFFYEGPYQTYIRINTLSRRLEQDDSLELRRQLLKEYIYIKEFRIATDLAGEIFSLSGDEKDERIYETVSDMYQAEIRIVKDSGKNNCLLLCLDGMRREDLPDKLVKTYSLLRENSHIFNNAYSYSTMTYESLVPVFSGNTDQRTGYYLREEVESHECGFINKALGDNRFVAIYGDGNHYIHDESIKYSGSSQTITEKLWDFVLDIEGVDNGLFYLHELYESHYSFANPYTREALVSNGSAMLLDFLPQNSGYLRTDYKKQQQDALRYLDDTLAPFIEALPCSLVLFADHGNLVLEPGTGLEDIDPLQLTASEDWIRIPLAIRSDNCKACHDDGLISLMELNDIMLAVLSGDRYKHKERDYIKIGRSAIYNQQFKELYRMLSSGYNGEAFEGFIFKDGYKFLVFEEGRKELYTTRDDKRIINDAMVDSLYDTVKGEVTIL